MYDYEAQGDDELTMTKGRPVEVLTEDVTISGDEGWWTGKIGDTVSCKITICQQRISLNSINPVNSNH